MTENNISFTGIVLAVIAIIGTLASALTYNFTADTIKQNHHQAAIEMFARVLPNVAYNNDIFNDSILVTDKPMLGLNSPQAIHLALQDNKLTGAIINATAPNGYNGAINILVGMSADNIVTGVRIVSHKETPGLGDAIEEKKSDWILDFAGKSLANLPIEQWKVKKDGGVFDQMTGATITPRAVVGAVVKAQQYFIANQDKLLTTLRSSRSATETKDE